MVESADLEIGIHRYDPASYTVEFRYCQPNSDAETRVDRGSGDKPILAQIDLAALLKLTLDPDAYGRTLTKDLFSDPQATLAFATAHSNAQTLGAPFRIRLLIGPSASELHALHWETLRNPQTGESICTGERLLFSRYLSSRDWRPVRLRSKSELQALVVVANPLQLSDYSLAPIDVEAELKRAQKGMGKISVNMLPDGKMLPTINNLTTLIRNNRFDILYLVCHGAMVKGEPYLWLESDRGDEKPYTSGQILVETVTNIERPPRLIILASCQSAGTGTGDALLALGPRLAEAGVPAVVAMQGDVSMETIERFMPVFFDELQRDGLVDRALAVARETVCKYYDFWVPALFLRLKSGRIWYVPSFGEGKDDFEQWDSLKNFIEASAFTSPTACTPIVGPGLAEPWFGRQNDIAREWAEKLRYPFSPYDVEQFPRVSQHVARYKRLAFLRTEFWASARSHIISHYQEALTEDILKAGIWGSPKADQAPVLLIKAVQQAAAWHWDRNPKAAHLLLAQLPLPIFITTTPGNLLTHALKRLGKKPQERFCPWNNQIPKEICLFSGQPTVDEPLVYHLFGHFSEPRSLVLTEDDYFDFLIGITSNKDEVPPVIRAALANSALLFLGFGIDDWGFRVLFRTLMAREGSDQLEIYRHVAAQIEPDEERLLDPQRARKLLEDYFKNMEIDVFWGRPEEFLDALHQHLYLSPEKV
ncbi:MAG: CHAT domain-containing protein [Chloroflexota bacterium]